MNTYINIQIQSYIYNLSIHIHHPSQCTKDKPINVPNYINIHIPPASIKSIVRPQMSSWGSTGKSPMDGSVALSVNPMFSGHARYTFRCFLPGPHVRGQGHPWARRDHLFIKCNLYRLFVPPNTFLWSHLSNHSSLWKPSRVYSLLYQNLHC